MTDINGDWMPHGEHPAFHWNRLDMQTNHVYLSCFDFTETPICRYLKQWVTVWNLNTQQICIFPLIDFTGIWSSGWWCIMVTTHVGFTSRPLYTWQIKHFSRLEFLLKSWLLSGETFIILVELTNVHSWNFQCRVDFWAEKLVSIVIFTQTSISEHVKLFFTMTSCPKSLTRVLRYPTLISESLGDRLGGKHLHLYWRDFNEGLGAGKSIFRSLYWFKFVTIFHQCLFQEGHHGDSAKW